MLLADPTVDANLLCQNIITLDVLLMLTSPPRPMKSFYFSPSASTCAPGDGRRRWNGRSKCLGVQTVHNQLFHALLRVIELTVRNVAPDLTHGHLICDECQEITDNLDLLVYHPLPLAKLHQE